MISDDPIFQDRPLDLVERCQEELLFHWQSVGETPIWRLSRGALDRFQEVDRARLFLPDSWRKLLVLANLTDAMREVHPEMVFSEEDYRELSRWSETLGESLPEAAKPSVPPALVELEQPDTIPPPSKPPGGPGFAIRNNYAFAACLAALVVVSAWTIAQTLRKGPLSSADAAVATQNAALREQVRGLNASLDESKERVSVLLQSQANGQTALRKATESVDLLKGALSKRSQEVDGLKKKVSTMNQLEQRVAMLLKDRTNTSSPALDLSFGLSGGDTASASDWETARPSYSAVHDVRPTFRWDPSTLPAEVTTVRVKLFRPGGKAAVDISDPVPAKDGKLVWRKPLPRGRNYQWLLASDTTDLRWLRIPFYLLSASQNARFQADRARAGSAAQRAATFERYRLYDDMLSLGGAVAQDAKAQIRKLASK